MHAKRNPELTRAKLLEAAFHEVYRHGFRAASIDSILETAGVTKGALYHHFPSKDALGLAIIDEVIREWMLASWVRPLEGRRDPISAMQATFRTMMEDAPAEFCTCGCPLNNLAQEMSGEDEAFRVRIARVLDELREGLAAALRRGQESGVVKRDVDPDRVAGFVLAAVEGIAGVTKNAQRMEVMRSGMEALIDYLEGLRARNVEAA